MPIAPWGGASWLFRAVALRTKPLSLRLARIAAVLALLTALLSAPLAAEAHALLVRADPPPNAELAQPPSAIEFWFSEPLEKTFTGARILRAGGTAIPTGEPVIDPDDATHLTLPLETIEPGIYTVVWKTLSSVDGHEWVGSFPLTLLNPDGSRPAGSAVVVAEDRHSSLAPIGDSLLRWLSLLGAALLVGPLSMRWLPARSDAEIHPVRNFDGLLSSTAMAGVLLLIVCGWLQFLHQTLRLGGIGGFLELLLATRPGRLVLMRQMLLAGVAPLLYPNGWAAIFFPKAVPSSRLRRFAPLLFRLYLALLGLGLGGTLYYGPNLWIFVVGFMFVSSGWSELLFGGEPTWHKAFPQRAWATLLTGAALLTFSSSSHAAVAFGSGWAVVADFVHLIAAAVWAGGLLFVALLLLRLRRLPEVPDPDGLIRLLRRNSLSAQVAVFILALTGLFSSFVQFPSLRSLFGTTYGQVLLIKLGILAAIMALAFLNNRAVQQAAATVSHVRIRPFARRVAVEAGMAVALLVSVAVLVQTPTPNLPAPTTPNAPSLPFNEMTYEGDLAIHLQVSPNRVGHNRYWAHLSHPDSSDIGEVQLVRLFFEHESGQMGQARLDLTDLGEDAFAAEGAFLNRDGEWSLSIYVRRRGLDDLLADVSVPVPSPEVAQKFNRSPWLNPVPRLPAGVLVGGLLFALSLVPLLWRRQLSRASRPLYMVLAMGALLFFISGALLGFVAFSQMNDPAAPSASRLPPICTF